MVTTGNQNLWLRARFDLDNRPIWFRSGPPIGEANAAEFELAEANARCRVYTNAECAPLTQLPPGHVAGSIPVTCLITVIELPLDVPRIGLLLQAQTALSNPSFASDVRKAAHAFGEWEKDGTIDTFKLCYRILYEAVTRPIEWIRDEYSQHWLPVLPVFIEEDQNTGKLGKFFDMLRAEWSLDKLDWRRLVFPITERRGSIPRSDQLLDGDDWDRLSGGIDQESDLTLHLITRARLAFGLRDHRTAVISAITAIEREAARFIQSRLSEKGVALADKALSDLGREAGIKVLLESLVVSLGQELPGFDTSVKKVVQANTVRNRLVHGTARDVPRAKAQECLEACEDLLAKILPLERRLRSPGWIPWDDA